MVIFENQIEGRNAVLEAISAGRAINSIYIKQGERHGTVFEIIKAAKKAGIPIKQLDSQAFMSMVKTRGHQGVIAIVSPKEYSGVEDIFEYAAKEKQDPFIMVLNELTDPQNLGSILRTADCLGVHGVVISKHRACGITPTVAKVSAGAVEYMRVARVTNINTTIRDFKQRGLWIVGADAQGENCYETDLTGPIALVIGGEDKGLGKLVKENCDLLVKIPMFGHINSLNAAVAASILGYEILRQRLSKNVNR